MVGRGLCKGKGGKWMIYGLYSDSDCGERGGQMSEEMTD